MNDELPLTQDKPVYGALTEENRNTIDAMSYEDMLRKVRCAPLGDPLFRGKRGEYFHARMKEVRHGLSDEERVRISKKIGY